jgi:Tfp pilus assembly protein PilO
MRTWYRDVSPPARLAMQVGLILLAVVLVIVLVLAPRMRQVESLRPQVTELSKRVETSQRRLTGVHTATDAERTAWAASRAAVLAKLPPDGELPKLVESLTLLAGRSRVADLLITTEERVALKEDAPSPLAGELALAMAQRDLGVGLGYYAIQVTFRTTYRDLARFLEGVQHLSPLVTVASLEVRRGVPLLGVQMVLRAYHSGGSHGAG